MDKIVVLGAGIYQVGLIRKAKSMGYAVHVVSREGNYPGIALADRFHAVDTTDKEGVFAVCKEVNPSFVVTSGSDVCMPALGYVNEKLGLPGVRSFAADVMSSKTRFREFERKNAIECPQFYATKDPELAWSWFSSRTCSALLKPAMSSGSRGIFKVDRGTERWRFVEKFNLSAACSLSKEVCVETLLPGTEIGGNAILKDGRCSFIAISRKHLDGFLVAGHEYPTNLDLAQQSSVKAVLEDCVGKLGYLDGPLNFDMMIDGLNARIIEPCARFGGNGLVDLCLRSFGVDLEDIMLRSLSGHDVVIKGCAQRPCGSYVFGADREGVLVNVSSEEFVKHKCPWLQKLELQRKAGDRVERMNSNAELIGFAVFDIPEGKSWSWCCEELRKNLCVKVC